MDRKRWGPGLGAGVSQGVDSILPLLLCRAISGTVVALPALVVGNSDELDRGEADEDRPQDRQPATGEKRAETDAEKHGVQDKGAGLRKGGGKAAVLRPRV